MLQILVTKQLCNAENSSVCFQSSWTTKENKSKLLYWIISVISFANILSLFSVPKLLAWFSVSCNFTPTNTGIPVWLFTCVSPNSVQHHLCFSLYGSCVSFMCVLYDTHTLVWLCPVLFNLSDFFTHTWTCMGVIGPSPLCGFLSIFHQYRRYIILCWNDAFSCVARHTSYRHTSYKDT